MELNLCETHPQDVPERFRRIYAFTTENLSGYLPQLEKKAGAVLTVLGSGDQLINLALLGRRDITCFDINPAAVFFAELKLAAIRLLSFEEFLAYLERSETRASSFSYKCFLRLAPLLSAAAREFFEGCYQANHFEGVATRNSALFNASFDSAGSYRRFNLYLASEKAFLKAREALDESRISFLVSEARNLASCLKEKMYGEVFLSNLADHCAKAGAGSEVGSLKSFVHETVEPLRKILSPEGHLLAAYVYDWSLGSKEKAHGEIDVPEVRDEVFGANAAFLQFEGVTKGSTDAVIILGA